MALGRKWQKDQSLQYFSSGLSSSTRAKWPCSIKDAFGRGPTRSRNAIPGHTPGELCWQGMCASGMQLDGLCLGKVVYPTNREEDRNSLITTLLPPRGFLCSKSPRCPLQPAPAAQPGAGHPRDQATPEQLRTACPSGRDAPCIPPRLPGWC